MIVSLWKLSFVESYFNMKILPFIFLMFFLANCKQKKLNKIAIQPVVTIAAKPLINYDSCKKEIINVKENHHNDWGQLSKENKERIFTNSLTNTILPSWIGTQWSFNGISQVPQQGSIACGYFVTTVLRDGGVNIARVKLAQCASEEMIRTLVQPKYIKRFSNVTIENFIESIHQQGPGLYIVGLDNHTGFIHNDGTEIYFIHSTFVGSRNVQKEKAINSIVLKSSKYKVLGKISTDEKILANWIKQKLRNKFRSFFLNNYSLN